MNEESLSSDECLVRVRAQVMTRDDSTGGWNPVGGGGLSFVELRRISVFPTGDSAFVVEKPKIEFVIAGHRITDNTASLSCVMKKAVQYNQVTPTFRHWQVHNKKYGLTFPNAADAKTFDVAMERAISELRDLSPEPSPRSSKICLSVEHSDVSTDSISLECDEPSSSSSTKIPTRLPKPLGARRSASPQLSSVSASSPLRPTRSNQSAQMVLPAKRMLSLPTTMTKSHSSPLNSTTPLVLHPEHQRLRGSASLHQSRPLDNGSRNSTGPFSSQNAAANEKYTYVDVIPGKNNNECKNSAVPQPDPPSGGPHDYAYPIVGRPEKRDSISSIKIHNLDMMSSHRPPLLPIKNKRNRRKKRDSSKGRSPSRSERSRCRYCYEYYSVDGNERGACEFAPDKVKDCINNITCVPAAAKILCFCTRKDPEMDEESSNPCSCDSVTKSCFGRWILLMALSLIMPCLCCYIPLKGCHNVGLACGLCGGRHESIEPR